MAKTQVKEVKRVVGLIRDGEMVSLSENGYAYRIDLTESKMSTKEDIEEIRQAMQNRTINEKVCAEYRAVSEKLRNL